MHYNKYYNFKYIDKLVYFGDLIIFNILEINYKIIWRASWASLLSNHTTLLADLIIKDNADQPNLVYCVKEWMDFKLS